MKPEIKTQLILRQLKDIQSQADKILSGDKSDGAIEGFSRYSSDLKDYIAKNISDTSIHSYLMEIPDINYSRSQVKFWQYIILPLWWLVLYKDNVVKNRIIEKIHTVKGKYAHLELFIKGLPSS
jgi:hypothetical protein